MNHAGEWLDLLVDLMGDYMLLLVKCEQRIVANTFSRSQSHFVWHRNELAPLVTKLTIVQPIARIPNRNWFVEAMEIFTAPAVN